MATTTRSVTSSRKTGARKPAARPSPAGAKTKAPVKRASAKTAASPRVKRQTPPGPVVAPSPLDAWKAIAQKLVDAAASEPSVKKKIRARQLREQSERLWDELYFSKTGVKGQKKVLKATRRWIDALLETTAVVSEKIVPKSKPKPGKKQKKSG